MAAPLCFVWLLSRPQMEGDSCPAGSVKCGVGSYVDNNATCQATLEDCPLTDISDFPSLANNSDFFVRTATDVRSCGSFRVGGFPVFFSQCLLLGPRTRLFEGSMYVVWHELLNYSNWNFMEFVGFSWQMNTGLQYYSTQNQVSLARKRRIEWAASWDARSKHTSM